MSKIEWTEKTWNPSIGCTKISEGCKNCYAELMARRLQAIGNKDYIDGFKFKTLEHRLNYPLFVKKPTMFFVNSMSDLFHEKMPSQFLDKVFEVMAKTPRHIYQVLTKRENLMYEYCKNKEIPKHIFLGVTIENKKALKRMFTLKKLNCKKFLSIEPLLEDLGNNISFDGIDWIILGGESGAKARPMKKAWVKNIRDLCFKGHIPFFFKQWGTYGEDEIKRNKKLNGRILEKKVYNEMPVFS